MLSDVVHHDTAVQRLVIMGGNEAYNKWTSTGAEFNFYCDPDAADMVIREVCRPAVSATPTMSMTSAWTTSSSNVYVGLSCLTAVAVVLHRSLLLLGAWQASTCPSSSMLHLESSDHAFCFDQSS